MILAAVSAKVPTNPAWKSVRAQVNTEYPAKAFYHQGLGLYVITSVEVAEKEIGPEYHISVSKTGRNGPRRCSIAEAQLVLKQFDAEGAREDNHTSLIRSFWMPVNESLIGHECECKDEEAAIIEGDFSWRPLTKANAERAKRLGAEQIPVIQNMPIRRTK